MLPAIRSPHSFFLTANEKDFSLSLEMTMRKTVFSLLPLQGDAPKAMCEEWQPYSYSILPPSLGRRCSEGAEVGWGKRYEKDRGEIVSSAPLYESTAIPISSERIYAYVEKTISTDKAFPAWGR